MPESLGMIVFAYGLAEDEPNPCNRSLGRIANRLLATERLPVKVAVQWETAAEVRRYDWCIGPYLDHYVTGEEVVAEAKEKLFEPSGVTRVIPVAQSYLQLRQMGHHIRRAGLSVEHRKIAPIGHCDNTKQWWTRSAAQLSVYAAMQQLWGYHGPLIVTEQMRRLVAEDLPPRHKRD